MQTSKSCVKTQYSALDFKQILEMSPGDMVDLGGPPFPNCNPRLALSSNWLAISTSYLGQCSNPWFGIPGLPGEEQADTKMKFQPR